MSRRVSRLPRIRPRSKSTKTHLLSRSAFGRRPVLERLERRDLLTGGMASGDVELLTVATLFDESPVGDEKAAEVAVESSELIVDSPVRTFMSYSAEMPVVEEVVLDKGEEVPADAEVFAVTAFYLEEEVPVEETEFVTFEAYAGETWDGELLDGELLDGEVLEKPVWQEEYVEYTDEKALVEWADEGTPDAEITDQDLPVRMRFLAADAEVVDAEVAEDGVLVEDGEPVLMYLSAEDGSATDKETWVTVTADGVDDTTKTEEVVEEPLLMRTSLTGAEDVVAVEDQSAEIMLFSAMGPSPWQNVDNPDDVNADGWATPFDALLVINRVNEGLSLTTVSGAEMSYYVDVNGDRCLDPTDAVQVINFLNGDGQELAADEAASRVAPLWYDDGLSEAPAWDDTLDDGADSGTSLDSIVEDESLDSEIAPYMMPRLMQYDESTDTDIVDEKKVAVEGEDEVYSEEVDWLADVI